MQKEEKNDAKAAASHKNVGISVMAPSGLKEQPKIQGRPAEEVGELYLSIMPASS